MTTFKTLTVVAALALAPGMSLAMGCSSKHDQQAQSCVDGAKWDSASQTCVPVANS